MLSKRSSGHGSKGQFSDAAVSRLQKQYLNTSHRVFRSPRTPNHLLLKRSAEASPESVLPKIGPISSPHINEAEPAKPGHRRTRSDQVQPFSKHPSSIFLVPLNETNSRTKRDLSNSSRKKHEDSIEEPTFRDFSDSIKKHFEGSRTCPQTTIEFYRLLKPIGRGAYSKVILATHKLCDLPVAIKAIAKERLESDAVRKRVFQEVMVLKKIQHPRVVKVLEVYEAEKHMLIVLEHMAGGDLQQFLKTKGRVTEGEGRQIFRQIVEGVSAVHSRRILHRDLKLDNILLDRLYSKVKICDFGICRVIKNDQILNDKSGTPAYVAPEVIAGQGYEGYSSDVWSLGVLLYALLTGTFPFSADTLPDLNKIILTGHYPPPPEGISSHARELIARMLNLVPSRRIKVKEILRHPWFSDVDSTSPKPPVFRAADSDAERSPILEETFVRRMENLGWPRSVLIESLRNAELDYGTAGYSLLKAQARSL
mmetsp:Transcript_21948/g.40066  ORF Transcript_21948/g.40066 Transcript_21948/m.40066 type:complete len:480 (-) Transcript_21948:22-1461(-)